ncbi:hypothetical protein [Fusobacterium sp.]|uniref:hypothetical protein n=1 Tax=Fusobacterium sp. TaxID=68766 RepID=UPI0028FED0BE|nr:hypothetical protein [Fusobacterium sp.]MDU1911574.1 hypothetical protein [Fusobacterium sp.]
MIRFDIFNKPAYFIAFSPVDEAIEEETLENIEEKKILEKVLEKYNEKNLIKQYYILDGIAAIKDYEVELKAEEDIGEKLVIDKETVMNLNQFSIFKGIIDFI